MKLQKGFAEGAGLSGLRYFKSVWGIKGASDPAGPNSHPVLSCMPALVFTCRGLGLGLRMCVLQLRILT